MCESDFTKGLAEMTATEQTAASEYDRETKENEITKATKDQDVKYKTKEAKGLDKGVAEATADRSGVQEELDAVNQSQQAELINCENLSLMCKLSRVSLHAHGDTLT